MRIRRPVVPHTVFAALIVAAVAVVYRISVRTAPIPSRAVEGRVAGLAYGPPPPPARGNFFEAPKARASAAKSIGRSGREPRDARGALAVRELERCTRSEPENDRCWSDLAAAYIESGRHDAEPREFARALAAADRALLIAPTRPEALFNRAVALELLLLAQPAAVAWRRYLTRDGDSLWASEARERKRALETRTASESWKEAMARLDHATKIGDTRTIEEIVRAFPQDARTFGERRFTCEWEEALRDGENVRAADRLAMARQVGAALRRVNGEELLGDAIDAIDSARPSQIARFMDAYRAYGQGRVLYAERNATDARPLFAEAAAVFRRLGSPMFRVAEYYLAGCLSDLGENDASLELVERHLSETPSGYIGLRAQLFWQKGIVQSRSGLVFESMNSFTTALQMFDGQSEQSNASQIRASLDVLYGSMGREAEAWRLRREAFRDVSRLGNRGALQTALMGAGGAEAARGRWDVAMSFYSVAIEEPLALPNPVHSADAAIWRALAAHRLGWNDVATRVLARAHAEVAALKDPALGASSRHRLLLAEGTIVRDHDPARAAVLLTTVIEEGADRFRLPEAYLERGRAWREQERYAEAIADFRQALVLVERREEHTSSLEQRASFFATANAAAEEQTDLLDRLDRRDEALAVAERNRTRSFMPSSGRTTDKIDVPEGTLLAHYTSLPDRLLIFLVSFGRTDVVRVSVSRAVLEQTISRMTAAIRDRDRPAIHAFGRELHDWLIAPLGNSVNVASRLVIVPDVIVAQVPFAALQTASDRFLLEEEPSIVYAPSVSAFMRGLLQRPTGEGQNVLAVGDPDFARTLFPELPRLPAAETEARAVARLHPFSRLFVGQMATPARVVEAMRSSWFIDIAAHAVVDRRDPARSALLLASSAEDSGVLYMSDIADLTVPAAVVMLAGCNTSEVVGDAPPSMRSFAFAFLAAGSRNVIGSLWAADDTAARVISHRFHQRLREGAGPAVALRDAQLAMLRSPDPHLRDALAWSGYQLYGTGS